MAVTWPKGSRPVRDGGKPGVRVGAFLGRFGGTVFYEGDLLIGSGSGGGPLPEMTVKPGDDCRSGTYQVSFGTVERVAEFPDN